MATRLRDVPNEGRRCIIAGVDWGGGGVGGSATVVTLGYIREDKKFIVVRFEQLRGQEDPECVLKSVAKLCDDFGVRFIGADAGGNGSVYNRLLLDKLGWRNPLYAILYSSSNQEPKQEGALHKWTVDRTGSIGSLFTRIKKQMTHFPRVEDSGRFLDQFTCEVAEYDEHNRTVRYVCPENQNDDALHSLNYAQLVALRLWHVQPSIRRVTRGAINPAESSEHRLRHVPKYVSQIDPWANICVSTVTTFVSHSDVSPFAMVRGVTTFMSATIVVWDIKVGI